MDKKEQLKLITEDVINEVRAHGKVKMYEQVTSSKTVLEHCTKYTTVNHYLNSDGVEFIIEDEISKVIENGEEKVLAKEHFFYKVQKDDTLRKYMHFPDNPPAKPEFDKKEKSHFKVWDGDIKYMIFTDHIEAVYFSEDMQYHTYIKVNRIMLDEINGKIKSYKQLYIK